MVKILLLAHGKNYGTPHLPIKILNYLELDNIEEVYTVDISEDAQPTQILDLCSDKINVNDNYFDIIIDSGGLAGEYRYYKYDYFWNEMFRVIKYSGIFYGRAQEIRSSRVKELFTKKIYIAPNSQYFRLIVLKSATL